MSRSAHTGVPARSARATRYQRPRPGLRRLALLALLAAAMPAAAAENRLARSDDPYLLMHAHDPVDWYPWGPEALDKARREDKPIFLSVGFSACFWCHTMQRESFSDPAIAAVLNASFVAIKVDREQRPELDALYGLAADVLAGQFGWPNNVFLTPDGKPFADVSYMPPHDDSFGQPGFDTVLATERDLWAQHRDQAVAKADRTVDAMRDAQAAQSAVGQVPLAPDDWMARAQALFLSRLDAANGGLGGEGGKSPHASVLALMLAAQRAHPDAQTADWLRATLDGMAFGGIDDQLAGGFHRYSTDETWAIPHYEKMLGDNAQLLAAYADAASLLRDPFYREVAIATGTWMIRELGTPDGGFRNSEDARSGDAEGASYLWSREEIAAALGAHAAARFLDAYAISSDQPATHGEPERGVLRLRVPIADTLQRTRQPNAAALLASLAPERAALLAVRDARPQPRRNTQLVVAENGLAIAALAGTAERLGRPDFMGQASIAAIHLWDAAWDERAGLLHHELIDGRAEG
ncbi:MAG: thioredoxin domain-containing protein, partial [Janthinobacterium lividum]